MRRDHLQTLGDGQARRIARHEKGRDAPCARSLAGSREDDIEIGDPAIGDPGLFAGQKIVVSVAGRRHVHVCHVRSRARLRQREGGDRSTTPRLVEPALLLGRPEQADRAGAQSCIAKRNPQPVRAGERRARQAGRSHVEHAVALRLDGRRQQPTVSTKHRNKIAACAVDIPMCDRQVARAPLVEAKGMIAVSLVEERPAEEGAVEHQSPSNTGCFLSTKAR